MLPVNEGNFAVFLQLKNIIDIMSCYSAALNLSNLKHEYIVVTALIHIKNTESMTQVP